MSDSVSASLCVSVYCKLHCVQKVKQAVCIVTSVGRLGNNYTNQNVAIQFMMMLHLPKGQRQRVVDLTILG